MLLRGTDPTDADTGFSRQGHGDHGLAGDAFHQRPLPVVYASVAANTFIMVARLLTLICRGGFFMDKS